MVPVNNTTANANANANATANGCRKRTSIAMQCNAMQCNAMNTLCSLCVPAVPILVKRSDIREEPNERCLLALWEEQKKQPPSKHKRHRCLHASMYECKQTDRPQSLRDQRKPLLAPCERKPNYVHGESLHSHWARIL
mmetsp:Transcript_27016/g.63193  ORF Transcript_27016/g.63193 Transcript_27016/m.63193 type:complete len:138 (-) Transcript_27016:651-1064(-)